MILAKKNMVGKGACELFWWIVVGHHHGEPLTTLGRSRGRRTAWRARCRQARARSPARGGRSRSGKCRTWHSRRSRSTWKIWICDLRNVQDLVWPLASNSAILEMGFLLGMGVKLAELIGGSLLGAGEPVVGL